ncbi:MAG TPA: hypothetical protein VMG10_19050 [Gemmataceae bacterium]|nr:hypothetical protein [Gemmataceae bacterium]
MFSWKLPFDLGDILLTPQWAGLNPLLQAALLAGVCLVPLALVLWLYRYEMQLVARSTALGLLCLRGTVLALLLILVCLQPIYGRTRTDGLPGYVLVAVDRSESMDVADRQRPPVEKLRLARALKLADGICSDAQLADWIKDYEQRGSPQWIKSNEPHDDLARMREITKERRAVHDRLCALVDELTRTQAAERILSGEGVRLLSSLTAKHDVELLGFHREAWELKPEQLEELFRPSASERSRDPARQDAAFTDLRLPLTHALERSGPGQGKVLGIVLLTDGQHNAGEPPTVKARELGERHLPIYPIALGARQPPPDAAMVAVQAPNAVFKDVDTPVEATFKITGLPAQDFLVELHRMGKDGKQILAERIVHHQGKDRTYSESFPVRMDEVGTQTLQATIRPVNPDTKETRGDNNDRATTVSVADDKANVLLIDGEARWEYHYLATALKRDRTMKVESVVFHQPRLNENLRPDQLHKMGLPRQQLPTGADALAGFDCIILGDVGVEQLPLAERQRLEKYVAERGGTLVILAGKRFMPLSYPDIEANGEADPLRKLLPIELPRVVAPDDGFPVTLTQTGKETKFLEMDAEPARSAAIWRELPGHFWGVVGRAKPGATTLAYVPDAMDQRAPAEAEKQSSLIVRQNYGFGRVLFVGLDSTWRWRYRVGDLYHHTFWGAAIRWAASDKPLMTGNDYIRFGTSQPIYSREEEVKLVVRLNEELGPLKPDLLAAARILKPGKTGENEKAVALVPLSRRAAQPRVLEGRLRDLPPGEYAIELVMPDYADKLTVKAGPPGKPNGGEPGKPMRASFTIRPPDSKEMIDLETRWPLLEEIAAKSGGKVFTPENAGELVDLLVKQSVPHTERHEQKLWQWWVLLVLMLAFLTVEWAARKLAGLP